MLCTANNANFLLSFPATLFIAVKVKKLWEGHKIRKSLPPILTAVFTQYCQKKWEIFSNFMALENLKFQDIYFDDKI